MHGDRGPKIAAGAPGEMTESSLGPRYESISSNSSFQKSL